MPMSTDLCFSAEPPSLASSQPLVIVGRKARLQEGALLSQLPAGLLGLRQLADELFLCLHDGGVILVDDGE